MSNKKSVINQIYDYLKEKGYSVHYPGYKELEGKEKYIVIKADGTFQPLVVSSERPIYTIMCYVPEKKYSELEAYVLEVKHSMLGLSPLVMYNRGSDTPSYYDEDVKAHMVSFQYYGCRRVETMLDKPKKEEI